MITRVVRPFRRCTILNLRISDFTETIHASRILKSHFSDSAESIHDINDDAKQQETLPISLPPVKLGPFLTKYGLNLTKQAADGRLDPVLGREDEIARAIQVLTRRTKNNPCLTGEPGVGKSAIVEGIARMIFMGTVPESMKNKVIISLDLASMLAGAKFRGEFEERLKGIVREIEMAGERVILFIDEIHVLVGAGGAEGGIDASNILKPALARGLLRCMGATTNDEYRKYIEKDAALARRFQKIDIPEPTVEDTIQMLNGLRNKYEAHHGVRISDNAIAAAAKLSHRYITNRRLPDKAVDLLDETASKLRINLESVPSDILIIEKKLADIQLSKNNPEGVDIDDLMKTKIELYKIWNNLRENLKKLVEARSQIEMLGAELGRVIRLGNYERAREIENVELVERRSNIESYLSCLTTPSRLNIKFEVNDDDIADVVAQSTGIPVGKLLDFEKTSLLNMENELEASVIGQPAAISAIAKCIRLSRAGLRYHDRPLGVFLLLGPTGTGKTELAKTLAVHLFRDVNAMLRIDMSEYMERHSVSRLVGAPPGYVGYEEGGILTEAVRRRPYQVILFDEFEKAHRDASNLLLQVMDEGRLSDSHGRVADFKNTVIIMTANLGSEVLYGDTMCDEMEDIANKRSKIALEIVNKVFSPEFVNRIDEVICFQPIGRDAIRKITAIQLERVKRLLLEKGIAVGISEKATEWLSATGFDTNYGARPLKRLIQSSLLNPVASLLLENKIAMGSKVFVSVESENASGCGVPLEIASDSNVNHLRFWLESK